MRKLLSICLITAMMFGLWACGDAELQSTNPTKSSQATVGKTELPTDGTTTVTLPTSTEETVVPTTVSTTVPTTVPTTLPVTEPPHTHDFQPATCTAPKTCSCGATEGTANGHRWEEATYATPKMCSVCNATEGTPIEVPNKENYHGHVYTGGEYSKKFHYEAACAGKNSHEITWEEVQRRNLGPCGTCVLK